MAGEYATSLRKTPVVATPAKAPVKTAPKQAAPVVEKPKTVTPPKVTAPAPAPVAAPIAPPVAPPAAVRAQAAEAKVEQRAPIASTQAPPPASPSILGRVGNFLADYGKAAMSPLTEMAVIPMAQGTTQAYANQKVAATGVDVSKAPQVTISAEAKNKLNPFVDPVTGKVDRTSQALTGASIVGGAAAGAAVGKYVLPKVTQAVSNKVSRIADIPDPVAKFQGPVGKTLSDDEMLANAAKVYEGPQPYQAPYVAPTTSTGTKVKATLAAGLTAGTSSPANAGARAVIQDLGVVPRSSISRVTREFGGGPKTNTVTANGRQFTLDMPKTALASNRPVLTQTGPNSFTAKQAIARAARADATEASRSAARASVGVRTGAATAGYSSSSIPDSGISAISNRFTDNFANNAASTATKKVSAPSTADTIATTRAEDLAPVTNNVKNPFNNSVGNGPSSEFVTRVDPPEVPVVKNPSIPIAGDFKGGVGQQDVMLKKVF